MAFDPSKPVEIASRLSHVSGSSPEDSQHLRTVLYAARSANAAMHDPQTAGLAAPDRCESWAHASGRAVAWWQRRRRRPAAGPHRKVGAG